MGIRGRLLLGLLAGLAAGQVQATGYFLNGAGASARGMAGAGVALAEDAMSIANNPAAAVGLSGRQWQIGSIFLHPRPKVIVGEQPQEAPPPGAIPLRPGIYSSRPEVATQAGGTFAIPFGAISWRLNERWAVGLSVYGNGGLNSTFRANAPNPNCGPGTRGEGLLCGGTLSSDIGQTFISPTVAWQPLSWLRLGLAPQIVWQSLEIQGFELLAGQSNDPDNFTNNGHDHALGYALMGGLQINILDKVQFGLVAQTKTEMDEFDDYAGLLPEQGKLDIAPYFQAGLAWDVSSRLTFAVDFQRIYFGSVSATGNDVVTGEPYGADNGPGFGWGDTKTWKFGFRYRANDDWTFRGGYADGRSQIESDEVFYNLVSGSILADRFDIGVTRRVGEKTYLDATLGYFPDQQLTGPNATLPEQEITLSLGGVAVDLGIGRRF
jgi:long-chain fatty acid transport protein